MSLTIARTPAGITECVNSAEVRPSTAFSQEQMEKHPDMVAEHVAQYSSQRELSSSGPNLGSGGNPMLFKKQILRISKYRSIGEGTYNYFIEAGKSKMCPHEI